MRIAHSLIPWSALVLAAATPWAQAQTAPPVPTASSTPADWLSPAANTLPLQHQTLPASGGVEQTNAPWADANAAVAAFPRGHADVLRWEAAQRAAPAVPAVPAAAAAPAAATTPSRPAAPAPAHHHGGQH